MIIMFLAITCLRTHSNSFSAVLSVDFFAQFFTDYYCFHGTNSWLSLKTTQGPISQAYFNVLSPYETYLDSPNNFKLSENGRNAACFIQLVMTSLWGIGVGIQMTCIDFLKIEIDLLLQPIKILWQSHFSVWSKQRLYLLQERQLITS